MFTHWESLCRTDTLVIALFRSLKLTWFATQPHNHKLRPSECIALFPFIATLTIFETAFADTWQNMIVPPVRCSIFHVLLILIARAIYCSWYQSHRWHQQDGFEKVYCLCRERIRLTDLSEVSFYSVVVFVLMSLHSFLSAVPTAELEPITENYVQSDEVGGGFWPHSFLTWKMSRLTWAWLTMSYPCLGDSAKFRNAVLTARSRSWSMNGVPCCHLYKYFSLRSLVSGGPAHTTPDCREGETIPFWTRKKPAQDDDFDTCLPCGRFLSSSIMTNIPHAVLVGVL